jgi:F0F1-type ATP synthase membrane subunit c/vacuolar-type H+-ATPase subunit K
VLAACYTGRVPTGRGYIFRENWSSVHHRTHALFHPLFAGMILILIFAEALALYGLIGA